MDCLIDPAVWCPWGYAIASVDARGSGHSDGAFILNDPTFRLSAILRRVLLPFQETLSYSELKTRRMVTMLSNSSPNSPSAMVTLGLPETRPSRSVNTLSRLNNPLRSRRLHLGKVLETCTESNSTEVECESGSSMMCFVDL